MKKLKLITITGMCLAAVLITVPVLAKATHSKHFGLSDIAQIQSDISNYLNEVELNNENVDKLETDTKAGNNDMAILDAQAIKFDLSGRQVDSTKILKDLGIIRNILKDASDVVNNQVYGSTTVTGSIYAANSAKSSSVNNTVIDAVYSK